MASCDDCERALAEAACSGDIGSMRAAIAEGARDLPTALAGAAFNGRAQAVAYLLDVIEASPGLSAPRGVNPASKLMPHHKLVRGGEKGELPRVVLDPAGALNEALRYAGMRGHAETVELLLSRGADAQAGLASAVTSGRVETAKLLLESGASAGPLHGYFQAFFQRCPEASPQRARMIALIESHRPANRLKDWAAHWLGRSPKS